MKIRNTGRTINSIPAVNINCNIHRDATLSGCSKWSSVSIDMARVEPFGGVLIKLAGTSLMAQTNASVMFDNYLDISSKMMMLVECPDRSLVFP
jgi:hypothetical protein